MSRLAVGYLIYLTFAIAVTVFVGRTLHRHGRLFLIDVFHGQVALADAVNHLLLIGFYLLNLALVLLSLRSRTQLADPLAVATFLTDKLSCLLLVLGGMHFVNVTVLLAVRRHAWQTPAPLTTFLD